MERPLCSYNGMCINEMLIISAIFFLLWLGLMIPITYPTLDYLKNEKIYKQWKNERQIIELNSSVIDEAIQIAQAFWHKRSIDRKQRLHEKVPELQDDDAKKVFEYYDKFESQAIMICERIREGRKTIKTGIKELSFKFPQVKKKRIEMAINHGIKTV